MLYDISVLPPTIKYHVHTDDVDLVNCIVFHPTLPFLAIGSEDAFTELYNISALSPPSSTLPSSTLPSSTPSSLSLTAKYRFQHHDDTINSVMFHNTLQLLATGSYDNTIILYDLTILPPSIKHRLGYYVGRAMFFHPILPLLVHGSINKTLLFYNLNFYNLNRISTTNL